MRRLFFIIRKEILGIVTNPSERFVLIIPIIIQVLVFSYVAVMDVKNISIGVMNKDNGKCAEKVIDGMRGSKYFTKIVHIENTKQLQNAIDNQEIFGAVIIQNDFSRKILAGEEAPIQTVYDGRRMTSTVNINSYVSAIIAKAYKECVMHHQQVPKMRFLRGVAKIRHWFNESLTFKWFLASGILVMVVGTSVLQTSAMSIAKEREFGTFEQLIVSPATTMEIVISKGIAAIMIGAVQGIVVFIIVTQFMGVPFRGSILVLIFCSFFVLLSMVSLGLFISSKSSNQQQATLLSFFCSMPIMITCGFSTSAANMPLWMQKFTYMFNPMYHGIYMARAIFLRNVPISVLLPNLLQTILISSVALFFTVRAFKNFGD